MAWDSGSKGVSALPRRRARETSASNYSEPEMLSRRAFLRTGLAVPGIAWLGNTADLFARLAAQPICPEAGPLGELISLVPFLGDRAGETPPGTLVGGPGLDARLFTDLSDLQPDRLITPTPRVFVRTSAPAGIESKRAEWEIAVHGVDRPVTLLRPRDFAQAARPMGAHLIECAGNTDPRNFGLMSVAEWDGVPLMRLIMPHVSLRPARPPGGSSSAGGITIRKCRRVQSPARAGSCRSTRSLLPAHFWRCG